MLMSFILVSGNWRQSSVTAEFGYDDEVHGPQTGSRPEDL